MALWIEAVSSFDISLNFNQNAVSHLSGQHSSDFVKSSQLCAYTAPTGVIPGLFRVCHQFCYDYVGFI
jgi:hypothetical protein